jgi:predicted nuclease of predicted toxin-antitoxin system
MKLLFDEHISFRTVRGIRDLFPDARHLKFFDLEEAPDLEIWSFAKKNGYAIVTKDDDFRELSMAFGHPPKVIWIKAGNIKKSSFENFLRDKAVVIRDFTEAETGSLLVLR